MLWREGSVSVYNVLCRDSRVYIEVILYIGIMENGNYYRVLVFRVERSSGSLTAPWGCLAFGGIGLLQFRLGRIC